MALVYATIAGDPVVYDEDKNAWWVCFYGLKWTRFDYGKICLHEAHRAMSKANFERGFPDLPPLPSEVGS
jgi:hypothetical protein